MCYVTSIMFNYISFSRAKKKCENLYNRDLPKPKWAFKPPKFLTLNNPLFLKLQLTMNPKSDSHTQVDSVLLIVPEIVQ